MLNVLLNWWAILVAVAANFVLGGLWYSPALFMKPWLRMSGLEKSTVDAGLAKALFGDLVASLLMAVALSYVIRLAGAADWGHGLLVSFYLWLGLIVPVLLVSVTYEHRKPAFFAINAGFRLISMLVMGSILVLWK